MNITILAHNYTGQSLTLVANVNGSVKTHIVSNAHPNWKMVMEAYRKDGLRAVLPLLDLGTCIQTSSKGRFVVKDGVVYFNGYPTSGYLFEKILLYMRELPNQYQRLVTFAENLYDNPCQAVQNDLYKFLEHGGNPITEDGCFLAYKGVDDEYWSLTAGKAKLLKGRVKDMGHGQFKIWNAVGEHIQMDEQDVNPNPNEGCSFGLHAGSFSYANGFKGANGRLMIVKVNPKHVRSVPKDESFQKLRATEYVVIAEEGRKLNEVKNVNFDKAAAVRYHNRRGADGKFVSANAPVRDAKGRFTNP